MNILIISAEVAPYAKVGGLADVAGALPRALHKLGHDVRIVMPCYKMIETDERYQVSDKIILNCDSEFSSELSSELSAFTVPIGAGQTENAFVKQTTLTVPGHSHPHTPVASAQTSSNGRPDGRATTGTRADKETGSSGIPVYLIGSPLPSTDQNIDQNIDQNMNARRSGYFQDATRSQKIYTLEADPYIFFCRAVLEMLTHLAPSWVPDILHCNDWQTGLVPVYAKTFYSQGAHADTIGEAATIFTIHNLAYQGNFDHGIWHKTGLPDSLFNVDGLEFYGQWTFMKGGIQCSDRVNTVSPNYAREIQTPEYGVGLDGLMREKTAQGRLSGILNGIDYDEYDPATDPHLAAHFDSASPAGKGECKAALQRALGLPVSDEVALVGVVSRLADQKGFDLIRANAEQMLSLPIQFVLLGTGDQNYERYFKELEQRYPTQARAAITFDIALAQRIYAGSDLFLMPSRFEPCGLGQLFALRYGTLPVVRATGGLTDTIVDYDPILSPHGNGFCFTDYSADALHATLKRALSAWQNKATRELLVQRALSSDFSWSQSAERYLELYKVAIVAHREKRQSA